MWVTIVVQKFFKCQQSNNLVIKPVMFNSALTINFTFGNHMYTF